MPHRASGPDPGAQAPTQAPVPPPATADDREVVIAEACDLLAARVLERADPRPRNPGRYLRAVRAGKITDHRRAANRHLIANPQLSPAALADLLEAPRPNPGRPGVVDRRALASPEQRARQQQASRRQAAAGTRQAKALAARPLPADGPARVAELRRQLAAIQEQLPAGPPRLPADRTNSRDALRALRHLTQEDR